MATSVVHSRPQGKLKHGGRKSQKKSHFNIASEASYVYILSRQKFIKNAKNGQFGMFWQTEATILTVLPDKPILIEQKSIESAKIRYSNATF